VKHFSLQLEAQSPLAIRADHAASGAGSAGYISGTALVGSLANVYRYYYPGDTATFERLFLNEQVHYPDLYPAVFKHEGMQNANELPVYPLPKTAQSCKRFPGFYPMKDEEVDDERHGVRDSLLDWAMFALGSKAKEAGQPIDTATLLKPLQEHKECQYHECHKPMDHFTGYYRRASADGRMIKADVETRLQTHTGINRVTSTVQEGILYNRQVFEEHMRFWGLVKLSDDLAAPFADFIEQVGQTGLVRVGTGRTRGMGKVNLAIEPVQDEHYRFDQFKQRLETFSTTLRSLATQTFSDKAYDLGLKPFYFALTLHSPVILRDPLLRYRGIINEETLEELLHIPADNFQLRYQAASTRRVSGWNELWGTPRTNEYALDIGSVFLFGTTIEPINSLWQALFRLEEEGAGRRRTEGFGRICVSDPFHLEVTLK